MTASGADAGAVLAVRDLRVSFPTEQGPLHAVDGISLAVRENEVLGVVGESGSGKSVTALAMIGLFARTASVSGEVLFRGNDLLRMSDAELTRLRGSRIAIVLQEALTALNPVYTIGHQLAEAITAHDHTRDGRLVRERVIELLELVGIGDAARRADSYPHELSGGMTQRVVLAMALANDPDVLIADEPTAALDVTIQAHVLDVLRRVHVRTRSSIVLITHDLGVVAGIADRVAVVYAGRVVEAAPVDVLFASPAHPYARGLLASVPRVDDAGRDSLPRGLPGSPPSLASPPRGCAFHPRCDRARVPDPCALIAPELAAVAAPQHIAACHFAGDEAVVQREADLPAARAVRGPETHSSAPILNVESLVKHFARPRLQIARKATPIHAVCGVSFTLAAGETLGLVGESGCGKSTAARVILNLVPATAGSVRFRGEDVLGASGARMRRMRAHMQVVFQDPHSSLNPRRTVGASIAMPLRVHRRYANDSRARVEELLLLVGLQREDSERYPHEFSGGQLQRICIARALILEPELVVLDEPVSALDVSVRAGIIRLMADIQDRLRTAFLFIAHDLAMVRTIADRVAVMYLGKIVESGTREDIFGGAAHPYTQALLAAIPVPDPPVERVRRRILLSGELPSAVAPPSGCRFRTRCWKSRGVCVDEEPALVDRGQGHPVACHFAGTDG